MCGCANERISVFVNLSIENICTFAYTHICTFKNDIRNPYTR